MGERSVGTELSKKLEGLYIKGMEIGVFVGICTYVMLGMLVISLSLQLPRIATETTVTKAIPEAINIEKITSWLCLPVSTGSLEPNKDENPVG